ncbi:MAG: DUF1273 family protein [Clostridia bacterium]|nr:DUF1273 family protein [Clostridia bacterium]
MSEQEKRLHRVCFTGHRPEKLKLSEAEVKEFLEVQVRQAIDDGYITFLSGMARGVDIWAAEIVLKIKNEGKPTHLICCIPYDNFEIRWSDNWQRKYRELIKQADIVTYTSHEYYNGCLQKRNIFMVDHAARLIGVYNGEPGGTRNTIEYAKKRGVDIKLL